jgi:hypothetical protein
VNKIQTFQDFLTTQSFQVPIWGFILNLSLAAVLSFLLSRVYIKYGTSLSSRRLFANNFILMSMTTMLIISVVKSSLALSLGLVGALSIVRFRAAIKEPEELSYLFLTIAIGLGFGADQRLITTIAFIIICSVIFLKNHFFVKKINKNLFLTIISPNVSQIASQDIVAILKTYFSVVEMKRYDETKEELEATFSIEVENFEQFQKAKDELRKLHDSIKITFMENKGVF